MTIIGYPLPDYLKCLLTVTLQHDGDFLEALQGPVAAPAAKKMFLKDVEWKNLHKCAPLGPAN
jgi:hypothetical protein